jgi:hypothetical protein
MADNREAGGLRKSPFYTLTENDIARLKGEIKAINADSDVFIFNAGLQTGYSDETGYINIRGDVIPDKSSTHPRDMMSERAVLAHEYYGHYKYAPSSFPPSDWRDEFRASYMAAINTPNLSDDDRRYLMLDAYERAKESGMIFDYSKKAREIIYGY